MFNRLAGGLLLLGSLRWCLLEWILYNLWHLTVCICVNFMLLLSGLGRLFFIFTFLFLLCQLFNKLLDRHLRSFVKRVQFDAWCFRHLLN